MNIAPALESHGPALTRAVGQEKVEGEIPAPTPALEEARALTLQAALAAGRVQEECGMQLAAEDFVNGALKWGLMEVPARPWHVQPAENAPARAARQREAQPKHPVKACVQWRQRGTAKVRAAQVCACLPAQAPLAACS